VHAIRYGDVLVDGERWPGFLHLVEHPQGRVLVDTGFDRLDTGTRRRVVAAVRSGGHPT
jgi:hypothetical protein